MPTTFSFSANTLVTPSYLALTQLSPGSGTGIDDPSRPSAIAPSQAVDANADVDVVAVTLQAGQSYTFDIDDGAGDASGGSVDLEFELIDQYGNLVLSDDGSSSTDSGSVSTLDPRVTVDVSQTGTYFVAIHAQDVEYIDGTFGFDTGGSRDTGDYSLVVSAGSVPSQVTLGDGNDIRGFTDNRDNVTGGAGADRLYLYDSQDIASGGSGGDSLFGGNGDDELSGANGRDTLSGDNGDDALIGGADEDRLNGGGNEDALSGGTSGDLLYGGSEADILWGEGGTDRLYGESGADFLRGGGGGDTLTGGSGGDTFHFLPGESSDGTEDRIADFEDRDVIDLSDLLRGGLTFVGEAGFSGNNQVRVRDLTDSNGNGYQEVKVNLDGDNGDAELAFLVDTAGNFALDVGDFIL